MCVEHRAWQRAQARKGVLLEQVRLLKSADLGRSQNRVVHSSHFWLIVSFIFGLFSGVWQKNDQNNPKNETKNDVKNGYCEHSEIHTYQK